MIEAGMSQRMMQGFGWKLWVEVMDGGYGGLAILTVTSCSVSLCRADGDFREVIH